MREFTYYIKEYDGNGRYPQSQGYQIKNGVEPIFYKEPVCIKEIA